MAIPFIRKPRGDPRKDGLQRRAPARSRQVRQLELVLCLGGDVVLIALALQIAAMLAPGGWRAVAYGNSLLPLLVLALAVKIPLLQRHGLYCMSRNYGSARELSILIRAVTLSSLVLAGVVFAGQWFAPESLPKPGAALAMDYLLSLMLLGGFRFTKGLTHGLPQG